MSRRRCANCKGYFDNPWYASGVESFCTETCAFERRNQRSKVLRAPNKDDIPADVRASVLKRDGSCMLCPAKRKLHVHHIFYRPEASPEWRHDPSNLITLCQEDHDMVHSDKSRWQEILLDINSERGYSVNYEQAKSNGCPAPTAVAKEQHSE